jgi:hypothetical protein
MRLCDEEYLFQGLFGAFCGGNCGVLCITKRSALPAQSPRNDSWSGQKGQTSQGETYNMAEAITRRNFEFSTEEIARIVNRWRRLPEAKKFAAAPRKPLRMAA